MRAVVADRAILPVGEEAIAGILALNNAHAGELSWLEADRLRHLLGQAFHARCIGEAAAFLLALDQDADYDSPNFLWQRARYPRFVYVDRIVVAPSARGRGYGRLLYRELFAAAARAGHVVVACEVNADPPNPASDAFHAAMGFTATGSATLYDGARTVRYFARPVGASEF
ncbi:MAG: GNAT family N-acetyltransferase [Alphaproteobacteria bacterium]